MLKKLLKYDFASLLRYWWIAAIASLGFGAVGGLAVRVLSAEPAFPETVNVLCGLTIDLCVVALSVFATLSFILVAVRFYKNFFTDEGYLTFTLPVKRSTLLNAKLLSGVSLQLLTGGVILLAILIAVIVATFGYVYEPEELPAIPSTLLAFIPVYFLEGLALIVLVCVSSQLFVYACITLGCLITRKAKVITSIAIYYGANQVFSFILQILYLFGISGMTSWLMSTNITHPEPLIALVLFGLILFLAMWCTVLYVLEYYMLDRKLNLT